MQDFKFGLWRGLKSGLLIGLVLALFVAGLMIGRAVAVRAKDADTPWSAPALANIDAEQLAGQLGGALAIPTISAGGGAATNKAAFATFHAYLAQTFPSAHAAMERETVASSLLYRWPGRDDARAPIGFLAHMDVVPVEPGTQQAWAHPLFGGVVADGTVYGRGAMDDKGSLIALMAAVDRLAAAGFAPDRDVYLLFGHDEEIGGVFGAGAMAALLEDRGVMMEWILDEGSAVVDGVVQGLDRPAALVSIAEKGMLSLRLSASAGGGHSSTPGPDTAASLVARAATKMVDNPYPARIDGPVRDMLEGLLPYMDFKSRLGLANLWLTEPLLAPMIAKSDTVAAAMRTTTALTILKSGVKDNVLPQAGEAWVNHRIHPRDTVESVKARAVAQIADDRVTVWGQGRGASKVSSAESAGFQAIAGAVEVAWGAMPVAPSLTLAATDTRHYGAVAVDLYRFSPFLAGPQSLKQIHGTDEQISVESLVRSVMFYEALIRDQAGLNQK